MTEKTDHWLNVLFRNGNSFLGNEGLIVPTGTDGQRPFPPIAGLIRFNSSQTLFEGYDGSSWQPLTIPGGALTTIDALTDTPVSKVGFPNSVMKIDITQNVVEYSNVLIESSGKVTVVPAYETLVTTDDVLTNKKYVDDTIASIGSTTFLELAGGTMNNGADLEMGSAGQVLADTGSASNPSYSFLGNIDTGIYAPVADNLVISTGGTDRISVSNAATDIFNTLELNGNNIDQVGTIDANTYTASGVGAQFVLPSYLKAGLPTGTTGGMIFVTDETGGAVPAFYDGANWLRVTDRAIVS